MEGELSFVGEVAAEATEAKDSSEEELGASPLVSLMGSEAPSQTSSSGGAKEGDNVGSSDTSGAGRAAGRCRSGPRGT